MYWFDTQKHRIPLFHARVAGAEGVVPRDADELSRVSIDSYGLGLVWASRFEVHVDQIIGLATRIEPSERRMPNPGEPGG